MWRTLLLAVLAVLTSLLYGCPQKNENSISCFSPRESRCTELPEATPEQLAQLPLDCAAVGGDLRRPAKCPSDRHVAKCTIGTGPGQEIRRFYLGTDIARENEACGTMARGVFSRSF